MTVEILCYLIGLHVVVEVGQDEGNAVDNAYWHLEYSELALEYTSPQ